MMTGSIEPKPMNEVTTKLLQQLAEKLGTTAEHLWQVLVRQAPISASITMALLAGLIISAGLLARLSLRRTRMVIEDDSYDDSLRVAAVTSWVAFVAVAIMAAVMLSDIETAVAGLINPEYWALKQVLK